MRTGDIVLDGQNRRYQIGLLLGRGLWGKTYRVTREGDSTDLVLKRALDSSDFPAGTPNVELLQTSCRKILDEQGRLLKQYSYPFLPVLEDHFDFEGEGVLILHRQPSTLEQRLKEASFAECLSVLGHVAAACAQLKDGPGFHGSLKPSNILISATGEVVLTDLTTPTARKTLTKLQKACSSPSFHPPEIRTATSEPLFSPVSDTYAIGLMLWMASWGSNDYINLPLDGLEKNAVVSLKDRVHARIKQEDSNPRFHSSLTERVAAVVGRAISEAASPSPPYRFNRPDELIPRIQELEALIRPEVTSVGRILLKRPPNISSFFSDEVIDFSVSVGCSSGVSKHEEIVCGVAVLEKETNERLQNIECKFDVTKNPAGRFRYAFKIDPLPPGNYKLKVAFAISQSGQEPNTRETLLEVRVAPGHKVPLEEPPDKPLELNVEPEEEVKQPEESWPKEQPVPSKPPESVVEPVKLSKPEPQVAKPEPQITKSEIGTWMEDLPASNKSFVDLEDSDDEDIEFDVKPLWTRFVDILQRDPYVVFMVGAALVIIILVILVLWLT